MAFLEKSGGCHGWRSTRQTRRVQAILIDMARRPPLVPFVTNNGGRQLFLEKRFKTRTTKIALVGTPCPY